MMVTILMAVVSHIQSLPMYLGNKCYRLRSGSKAHVPLILVTYTSIYPLSMRRYESKTCISSAVARSTNVPGKKPHP